MVQISGIEKNLTRNEYYSVSDAVSESRGQCVFSTPSCACASCLLITTPIAACIALAVNQLMGTHGATSSTPITAVVVDVVKDNGLGDPIHEPRFAWMAQKAMAQAFVEVTDWEKANFYPHDISTCMKVTEDWCADCVRPSNDGDRFRGMRLCPSP